MKKYVLAFFVLLTLSSFAFSQTDIRSVDFKNFTYQPYCAGPGEETQTIAVKDGMFFEEKEIDGFTNRFYFNVFDIVYGDVDGDNREEAIVLTLCNTGGTGNFTEGFLYGLKDGQPALLARIEGGDRADGGLRKALIQNGMVTIERSIPGELGGACCPEEIETTQYRFENNSLAQVGEKIRREIYSAERVEFEEGKSTTLLKLSLKADDQVRRYVVQVKKGQILEVITSSPDAKVRLHKGDGKLLNVDEKLFKGVPASNEFAVKAKQTGDFIFQVSNFADIDLDFFVTVKIK